MYFFLFIVSYANGLVQPHVSNDTSNVDPDATHSYDDGPIEKAGSIWAAPRGHEGYHYPYRPKFPSHSQLGICRLEDFPFSDKEDKLGLGGFGKVYRSKHVGSNRLVAVKFIAGESIKSRPKHVENEETIHRILDNSYIANFYCSMENPKTHDVYFVMEYFPGGNLSKALSASSKLPPKTIVKYIGQIIIALRYLHSHCIVYRDLKADNTMRDADDNIKLIDFGLSSYDCDNQLGNLAGTLEYIAPEIAAKKRYGRAADYYSAGIMLYILIKGTHPYRRGKTPKDDFIKMIANGSLQIPSTEDPKADQVISYLTTRDPAKRWSLVHVNFSSFKKLPFFSDFDWDYYERYPHYMLNVK